MPLPYTARAELVEELVLSLSKGAVEIVVPAPFDFDQDERIEDGEKAKQPSASFVFAGKSQCA